MPRRPLEILVHFRTRGSGAEGVHLAGLAEAFGRAGHAVRFVSPGGVDPRRTKGANPFGGGRPSLLHRLAAACPAAGFEFLELAYNLLARRRLDRAIRERRPDLLYERHAFFLVAGAAAARRHRIPFAVEVNELVGDERIRAQPLLEGLARRCDRRVFRAADAVVTVSPHLGRRVVASGGDPARVLVLPNAVDPSLHVAAHDPAEGRRLLGLGPGDFVVGFAGWFVPWHRLDGLLEAMALVARARPGARLALFGDGPGRGALEEQATRLGIGDRLVFLGAIPHRDLPARLAGCDVAVVPHSNAFRSPIKFFEYLAAGRATVAPATEPLAAVVAAAGEPPVAALFPPEDWRALADLLLALAADPARRAALGEAGRRRVLAAHTWDANAEAVLAALERGGALASAARGD